MAKKFKLEHYSESELSDLARREAPNSGDKRDGGASSGSLRNHFLVAMPSLRSPVFFQSVTYICDHSDDGAMGIVINHPLDITLDKIFDQLSLNYDKTLCNTPVLAGGPVSVQQGFVLHRNEGRWDSSMAITPEVCLTASRDIVDAIAANKGPRGAQFALGYAGWGAGQLEQELASNSWLTVPADEAILFDTPLNERRNAVAARLGIDMNLISGVAGHA